MRERLSSFFHSLMMHLDACPDDKQRIELKPNSWGNGLMSSVFINNHVKVYAFENLLVFEFFTSWNDVAILIKDSSGHVMYYLKIDTVKTLHIMVKLSEWPLDTYTVSVENIGNNKFQGSIDLQKYPQLLV